VLHGVHGLQNTLKRPTHRPDLRVKEPNFSAPTAMDCSIRSVWYDSREREVEDIGSAGERNQFGLII